MEKLVERVAKAIKTKAWELDLPLRNEECAALAHTAIEAMREPTPAMLQAMEPWARTSGHQDLVWRAGIDEALK